MTEQMRHVPYRHSIHAAMGVLAGQWVAAVLASLTARGLSYSELLADINEREEQSGWVAHRKPLSQKVLTETLARMQRDGLIVKREGRARFNSSAYQLTPAGRSLLRALKPLAKWAEEHRGLIEAHTGSAGTPRGQSSTAE